MKNKMKWILAVGLLSCSVAMAQQQSDILSVSVLPWIWLTTISIN